ncbi:repressor [Marinomonas sp. S3726]|uniref:LexA family protein n=1 Tax=Marinomonas sp. S3726 TaxID=579484 RepID=UPI0005FA7517|nr:XRE family transcriptional regulator [Marinomonas sp. S3726]KJZ09592.1 repressor [Marinomonas sp. S3726]
MNRLPSNIRARLKDLGMTQRELSERANISQVMIHKLLSGKSNTTTKILDLAKALQCDPDWLKNGIASSAKAETNSNVSPAPAPVITKMVPVISYVQAGEWTEAHDLLEIGDADWEPAPASLGPHAFWLKVVGDSMTSLNGLSIPEGHLILVDPDVPAENGSLVVAKLDATDEVTFKKLIIDAGQKYLKPLNPNYKMVDINSECQIVGVVLEAKVKF